MDETEIDPAIAAAMGFTSFGVSKKRKYHHSDTVVDAPLAPNPQHSSKLSATGINKMRLGEKRASPAEARPKMDDPGYTDDAASKGTSASQHAVGTTGPHERTSRQAERSMQTRPRIFEMLAAQTSSAALPRPPPASFPQGPVITATGKQLGQAELQALRKGVRNGRGDTVYFLPSFVEDPWASLRARS